MHNTMVDQRHDMYASAPNTTEKCRISDSRSCNAYIPETDDVEYSVVATRRLA
jgi:hypothetical protein